MPRNLLSGVDDDDDDARFHLNPTVAYPSPEDTKVTGGGGAVVVIWLLITDGYFFFVKTTIWNARIRLARGLREICPLQERNKRKYFK